ncbi:hypothetical protein TNCV_4916421 [Trichonephila clavipes]|nr:hypothetical protein TNCV_4916421 [Trichonephila clavipes]
MDGMQMYTVLSQEKTTSPYFQDVYSRDTLPPLKENMCAIVNSDESSQPGTHWLALSIFSRIREVHFHSFTQRYVEMNCLALSTRSYYISSMAFVAFPSFLPQKQLEQAVSLPPGEECAEGHSFNTFPNHISPPTLTAHRRKVFDKSHVNALPREQGSFTEKRIRILWLVWTTSCII